MNVPDNVRPAECQDLVAVFFPPIIIERRVMLVNVGSHRPVVDDDALANGLEKIGHQYSAVSTSQSPERSSFAIHKSRPCSSDRRQVSQTLVNSHSPGET